MAQCLVDSRLGFMAHAATLARQLIALPDADARLRLDARTRLIWVQFQDGLHAEANETALIAIQEAQTLQDPARESLARSYRARVLSELGAVPTAADEANAALRLARDAADPLALSVAFIVPAILCSRLGLYDAAVEMAHQAVKQAKLSGDAEALAHAISNYGSLHADYLYRFAEVSAAQKRAYLDLAIVQSRIATNLAHDHHDSEMQRLPGYNLVEFLLLAKDVEGAAEAMQATDAAPGIRSR